MKIELKNLKINLAFSEETTMFTADVYVDGKKAGYAKNDGRGGSTYYNPYPNMRLVLDKAEEYAKSLPPIKYRSIEIKSSLDLIIDDIVHAKCKQMEDAKNKKRIDKLCLNHIVWGVPNGNNINKLSFVGKPLFSTVLLSPMGATSILRLKEKVQAQLKEGEVIFNTNI